MAASVVALGHGQAAAVTPGSAVDISPWLSPGPTLSTSGDYATDTFSDPWDFSNQEDLDLSAGVGLGFSNTVPSIHDGILDANVVAGSTVRLLMKWPGPQSDALPWGRDGWLHPIDAARYNQVTMRVRSNTQLNMAIRFWTASGEQGFIQYWIQAGDWQTVHIDLLDRSRYNPTVNAQWQGPIVGFEMFNGGLSGNLQVDWFRLHRPDAPQAPPSNVPVPLVLSPNEQGGQDYATVENGNPWDFASMADVVQTHDIAGATINGNGDLSGVTVANDSFVAVPIVAPLNSDKYHRMTLDVCYDGQFDLDDAPGGGMVGRLAWMPEDYVYPPDASAWTETQDFVVFPGCHAMTIDMALTPAEALHDQNTTRPSGWRGIDITSLRMVCAAAAGMASPSGKDLKAIQMLFRVSISSACAGTSTRGA